MQPRPFPGSARPCSSGALAFLLVVGGVVPASAQPEPQAQPQPDPAPQPQRDPVPPPPGGDTTPPAVQPVPPPPPAGAVPPPPPAAAQAQVAVGLDGEPLPRFSATELSDFQLRLEPDPTLRLEGWLQRNSERASVGRVASAVLAIVAGAASITGAVWAYGLDDDTGGQFIGATFVGLGAMNLAMGVAFLNITTPQEDRFERWQQARRRGASALDVAAFEGEFRSEAEMLRFQRVVAGILGLSMGAGGGAIIALTAANRDLGDEERIIGYALGGTFLLTGALMGLLSLVIKSPVEQDWEGYLRGATPQDPASFGGIF